MRRKLEPQRFLSLVFRMRIIIYDELYNDAEAGPRPEGTSEIKLMISRRKTDNHGDETTFPKQHLISAGGGNDWKPILL